MLSHLLSGKSFELILNAATGTGKLRALATKLVRFNEANRQPPPNAAAPQVGATFAFFFLLGLSIDVALTCRRRRQDAGKSANARALLFDISFLMLCRIAQTYGVDVLLDASAGVDASSATFFELWASEWLRPGCAPDLQLARCDPTLTDQLLKVLDVAGARDARMVSSSSFCRCHIQQVLTSGDSDLRSGQVRWHDACLHVPAVVRQILDAWQARLVSDDDVERILDTLRTQMCCLAVCAAAWLRYHIQVRLPLLD